MNLEEGGEQKRSQFLCTWFRNGPKASQSKEKTFCLKSDPGVMSQREEQDVNRKRDTNGTGSTKNFRESAVECNHSAILPTVSCTKNVSPFKLSS